MKTDRITVSARVTGRVQGVYFRGWTQSEAEALDLAGWVRNEADGSVTALIVGPGASVAQLVERLWEGPPAAEVRDVVTEETEIAETPSGFTVAR